MGNIPRCPREGNPDFSRWMYPELGLKEFLLVGCPKNLKNYKTDINEQVTDNRTRTTKTSDIIIIRIKMKNNSAWSALKCKKKKKDTENNEQE